MWSQAMITDWDSVTAVLNLNFSAVSVSTTSSDALSVLNSLCIASPEKETKSLRVVGNLFQQIEFIRFPSKKIRKNVTRLLLIEK